MFYLADSFGSLYGEQITLLAKKYLAAMPGETRRWFVDRRLP
jgi:hypothetical protein